MNKKYDSSASPAERENPPSFGMRWEVFHKIDQFWSHIDWDDEQHGHLDYEDYFGNVDLGDTEIMDGQFSLGIYGGKNPLKAIIALCCE